MLVFRSLAIGLSAACLLLLAVRPVYEVHVAPAPAYARAAPIVSIVDVAPGVVARQLPALVRLAPDEHVISVDDHPAAGDLDAGAIIAAMAPREACASTRRSFVDLEVAGVAGTRRVLVLLH